MVPLGKTSRAQRGNLLFSTHESGLTAPVSLLVFHFNCCYYITLKFCEDGQLFSFYLFAFPLPFNAAVCF